MLTHAELKQRALSNPEVREAYNALVAGYALAYELRLANKQG